MTEKEKKQKRSLSIHQRIRKASFVPVESREDNNFKYSFRQKINSVNTRMLASWKRRINSVKQKPALWASFIDWKSVKEDSVTWLIESAVEGFTANFATHFLFGVPFTPWHIMAHGFAIKQGLSIIWRLRKDGPTSKLPKKNN